jgi:2-dehydro-3-deoxyphosphogluconate aldolase / (4S)-4-hydroxy-2-oxoglutarate aldolase
VTLDTPEAILAIERAARDGWTVGAGTVLYAEQVRACAEAGAGFVVSPGLIPEVVESAHRMGLGAIPGTLTPTEILQAQALGADAIKLFPASLGGPGYVRALRGPFPETAFVPTGGIGPDDVAAYLAAGATCVGLGSRLVGESPPRSREDLDRISKRAALAVGAAEAAGSIPTPERGA